MNAQPQYRHIILTLSVIFIGIAFELIGIISTIRFGHALGLVETFMPGMLFFPIGFTISWLKLGLRNLFAAFLCAMLAAALAAGHEAVPMIRDVVAVLSYALLIGILNIFGLLAYPLANALRSRSS